MCVCILALFIHHAMCLCHVILSPVVCLSVLYFSYYLNNGMISDKSLLNIKRVFWFTLQLLFETFLILRRIQQNIKVHRSSYKVPILLVTFDLNMNYLDSVSSDIKFLDKLYSGGWVVACGQTDGQQQLIVTFHNLWMI